MRPKQGDYNIYYDRYINLIDDDVINVLKTQIQASLELLKQINEEKGNYSYEEGKWTIKELLGHVIDTERIFTYRALSFARNEKQSLPGFEQDEYVANGNFSSRSLEEMINEFKLVRVANIILFESFDAKILNRRGIASENEITVLALIFIIAGHEKHHMKILKERYLNS
jgi:uncharacterized damage-inducible protein DinB